MLFGSRLSLQQHIGPQNLVNDLSIEREIAPNLFSFKHISFPFISSGIILHEWVLWHRNIHAANVAAIVKYCIYTCCQNIRKFMDNREFIANRVQSVSRLGLIFFSPWCNPVIGAIKENNCLPAFFPLLFCCVSSASAETWAFSTHRFEMNAALQIAEAPQLWAPQLALRPSARRSAEMMDGHELPVDVVCEGQAPPNAPSDWSM